MKLMQYLAAAVLSFSVMNTSYADPVKHYQGKEAESLSQAVSNFNKGNQRLAKLLKQDNLSAADIAAIHELTYTLENALAKINTDLEQLAVTLEGVHIGSEENDAARVKKEGNRYLAVTNELSALE
ncbi:MAG TPA: DUF6746 family protein [Methylophaga sp.]|nr:DUF6746 family protein [Methylophaga sp.]